MRNWLLFIILFFWLCLLFFFFQLHSDYLSVFIFSGLNIKLPIWYFSYYNVLSISLFLKVEMEADLVIEILLDSFSSCKMLLSCPLIFPVSPKKKKNLPEILLLLLFLHRPHILLSSCFKYFHFVNHFKSID